MRPRAGLGRAPADRDVCAIPTAQRHRRAARVQPSDARAWRGWCGRGARDAGSRNTAGIAATHAHTNSAPGLRRGAGPRPG